MTGLMACFDEMLNGRPGNVERVVSKTDCMYYTFEVTHKELGCKAFLNFNNYKETHTTPLSKARALMKKRLMLISPRTVESKRVEQYKRDHGLDLKLANENWHEDWDFKIISECSDKKQATNDYQRALAAAMKTDNFILNKTSATNTRG